ncbi:MAG: NlpC/P60 family protein [Bacteroidia bacterium]
MYFFTSEACVPMRSQPSEAAEMVSQLLFGDLVMGVERKENWIKVESLEDKYEGWVSQNMLITIDEDDQRRLRTWRYVHEQGLLLQLPDGSDMLLPVGARIPYMLTKNEKYVFRIGNQEWQANMHNGFKPTLPPTNLLTTAEQFLNTPYLWGGRGGFGIDCSGFTQVTYRMHGILIGRDSSMQAKQGKEVAFLDRRVGDLVFFRKPNQNKITHVGISSVKGEIIHCSGKVRKDILTNEGIVHKQTQTLTHQLIGIKRYY